MCCLRLAFDATLAQGFFVSYSGSTESSLWFDRLQPRCDLLASWVSGYSEKSDCRWRRCEDKESCDIVPLIKGSQEALLLDCPSLTIFRLHPLSADFARLGRPPFEPCIRLCWKYHLCDYSLLVAFLWLSLHVWLRKSTNHRLSAP